MSDIVKRLWVLHNPNEYGEISSRIIIPFVKARPDPQVPWKWNPDNLVVFTKECNPPTDEQLEEKLYHESMYSTAKLLLFEQPILQTTFSTGWKKHKQQSKKPKR